LAIFIPVIAYGSAASDFIVNRQSTYDVPYGTTKVLILDLTLPKPAEGQTLQLQSIKIHNAGTADHTVIYKLEIWEDGSSLGWDNDETMVVRIPAVPFFDTEISGTFREYSESDSWQRIFITLDISSDFIAERTIQPQLLKDSVVFSTATGPTDAEITGFERKIRHDASIPTTPVSPLAENAEALSISSIRWHFTDMSNNEFGFRILDAELNEMARNETADISYIDETDLTPNTEYSGRKVVAFNDRGESLASALAVFLAVHTLALEAEEEIIEEEAEETEEEAEEEVEEEVIEEPSLFKIIQTKIAEIQQKLNELIRQFNELVQEGPAAVWQGFQRFLSSFFGK